MRQKTLGKLFPYLLILPSLIILAGVVFYPIAASLLRSFQLEEGGWGLDNYIYFFTDPIQRRNILYTLQIVIVTVDLVFPGYLSAVFQQLGQPDDRAAVSAATVYSGSGGSQRHDHRDP